MRKILSLVLILFAICTANAQKVTFDDFKKLIPSLESEDWKTVFKESSKLLKQAGKEESNVKALIVYANIFSAAGMVVDGTMTYAQLEKNIKRFQGQKVIMPSHPIDVDTTTGSPLNKTSIKVLETGTRFSSATCNKDETSIFCFEEFFVNEKIDLANFPEKTFIRCGGTLSKIETNPNKSNLWILRLTIVDAFVHKID